MGTTIHPTAVIDVSAELADGVEIGPGAVVGPHVVLGEGTRLRAHSQVIAHTTLGRGCDVFPGAVVGGEPQDLKFKGEVTRLIVGDGNIIRECATLNRGTAIGGGQTVIGDRNLIMAYVHVAHDCIIGSECVITNLAQISGHVKVEDKAIISGMAAIHHFCSVGTMAFVAPYSTVRQDVPPYMIAEGNPAKVRKLNVEGLRRRQVPTETVAHLKDLFKMVYRSELPRSEALEKIEDLPHASDPYLSHLIQFYKASEAGYQGRALEAFRNDRVRPCGETDTVPKKAESSKVS